AGSERLQLLSWAGGRPVRVQTVWAESGEYGPTDTWAWAPDGRSACITQSSSRGVLEVLHVHFDAQDRLLRKEIDRKGTGSVDRVREVTWRSEERRVGKEHGHRWGAGDEDRRR